jgi:hypothetical protein
VLLPALVGPIKTMSDGTRATLYLSLIRPLR